MSWTLTVNQEKHTLTEDKRLIDFLREDLGLTSVKDGCSEGACGTCSVVVDGRLVKACIMKVSRFDGARITTVEGLSAREKEVYVHSFAETGAVQCGFCTPGMVMAAKVLLDKNPQPSREEIARAITGNLCRCTGYKKIIDAIEMAGHYFHTGKHVPVL
ncbi:MAG TPA: 2Fe-2S iron-sulfur cluster-binding protein, partial [Clostridia bacterium]|nr:2Fe-2S iron-sulfur cluster-binding protein [Clostridia bacterium]